MLFKKRSKSGEQKPQVMQINIVDVVKQANIQLKYEEIGSWLATHKTPLFYCHEKGFSVVDAKFIEDRKWLKDTLVKMVREIEKQKPAAKMPTRDISSSEMKITEIKEEPGDGYIG